MVAGRAMPLWLATFTMTATWVDGGYLLGTAEGTYRSSIASGLQGGVCFGISLIIGGVFFARRMRALEFHTLIDPFEARFGAGWAVVLALPAVLAEVFWSAELLVALGSTFGVVLGLNLVDGHRRFGRRRDAYTMAGGMWAVAYTDAFQLLLVGIGLAAALPFALSAAGGLGHAWQVYQAAPHEAALSRVVVGRQRDADVWRRAVELLFPASAVLPHAEGGAGAFDPVRVADDRADRSAAADGARRIRLRVAAVACGAPRGATGRCVTADLPLRGAAGDRPPRPRRDHRRGDIELLVRRFCPRDRCSRGMSFSGCCDPISRSAG